MFLIRLVVLYVSTAMEFVITWRERSRNGRADGNPTDQMHLFQNLLFQLTQLDKMLAVQKQESVVNSV